MNAASSLRANHHDIRLVQRMSHGLRAAKQSQPWSGSHRDCFDRPLHFDFVFVVQSYNLGRSRNDDAALFNIFGYSVIQRFSPFSLFNY